MTTATITMNATQALSYFVQFEDHKGERQWKLTDSAPEGLSTLIMDMHGDEIPNDWRYGTIFDIFNALKTDEPIDTHEIADGLVDIYNYDLKQWIATHSRDQYVDEAIAECLIDMSNVTYLVDLIKIGQFECIHQMVNEAVAFFELETV